MQTEESTPSTGGWLRRLLFGHKRHATDPHVFHKLSLVAFLAWVGLGADGISSSCYGPPEAFKVLGQHHYLALFLAVMTAGTIFVISASYKHIIEQFPSGGGGYLVASKLLSPGLGAVSGCALVVDYVLTIIVSIASGADAVFSLLPTEWYQYKLLAASGAVLVMIILNLRGVKESVLPIVPVFLLFLATHVVAIGAGFFSHFEVVRSLPQDTANGVRGAVSQLGLWGVVLLVLRAYSMGAGTYTGIEAISNGLPILREPHVETGKRTMNYMAVSLAVVAGGLFIGYLLFGLGQPPAGKTLNATLFESLTVHWPGGRYFVMVALASEALILLVAAQTGFLDGPRVLSNMALDGWMPNRFALLSDRLVTQNGVLLMGAASLVLLWVSKGSVEFLLVLYSINVFVTFSLSQLGMVKHWWEIRAQHGRWLHNMIINGLGLSLTAFILIVTICLKFHEGGWLTLIITGSLVALVFAIRRHYRQTRSLLKRLDSLVEAAKPAHLTTDATSKPPPEPSPQDRTAVILVNGYGGLGLHCLFGVMRLFRGHFKNFVFIQTGMVDAGRFKGVQEIQHLDKTVQEGLNQYVEYMRRHGYYATSYHTLGTDVVEEVENLALKVSEQFPNNMLFASQLVFPRETIWTRFLHNYTAFAIQRRLYQRGMPLIILPIRV